MRDQPALFVVPGDEGEAGPSMGLSFGVLGRIAELKAEALLLERGHKVARPGLDEDGVDFVVDYRLAVQVKSTARLADSHGARWEFEMRHSRKDGRRAGGNVGRARVLPHVDFWLLHARDADLWWVVPRGVVAESGRIRIAPGGAVDRSFRDAWGLLREE